MASSARLPLFRDFEVVRVIAKGGMGVVYEVRSRRTGAAHAAKTILKAGDQQARARFAREAELLARCDRHPGIVKVHSVGETGDGMPFMILDLVRGEGLDALSAREGTLEPRRAAEIARRIAHALAFVHARGIVHRDVKPSNVLLDAEAGGAPRLTDFGLATAADVERLTRTGVAVGTVLYCSPEQALGSATIGPAADVFSLGCVLFELLAGASPLPDGGALEVFQELAREGPLPDVRSRGVAVPAPLAAIVARAIAKPLAERYADASELAADLDAFVGGKPVSAVWLGARPRRRRWAVALASLVAVGVVGAGALGLDRRARSAAAALETARAGIAGARAALVAAVDSAAALAKVERELGAARTAAAQVREPERSAFERELVALDRDLAVEMAAALLAAGRAEEALPRLPPLADASPRERLLRAQALLVLGRLADAEALLPSLDGEPTAAPALAELRGDVAAARGDPKGAQGHYTRALQLGSRRVRELRVKRGSAAAQVGDDATALSDLAAALPDLSKLARDRTANADLAAFALPLYRRAVAAKDVPAAERDVAAAWLLADPPRELRRAVTAISLEAMGAELQTVLTDMETGDLTGDKPQRLGRYMRRARRALALEPEQDAAAIWDGFGLVRQWIEVEGLYKGDQLRKLSDALDAEWAEHPLSLFAAARWRWKANPREALDLLARAARGLPAPTPSESSVIGKLAQSIRFTVMVVTGMGDFVERDLEQFARLTNLWPDSQGESYLGNARAYCSAPRDPNRIEAERMTVVSCSRGSVEPWNGLGSRSATLRWWNSGARARLVLAFDSPVGGRRAVVLSMVTGPEFATAQLSINGGMPERVDCGARPAFEGIAVELSVELRAGRNELLVEIVEAKPKIAHGALLGLDYLQIVD